MKDFAARLKRTRENAKKNNPQLTQSYVAERVGVARTTYTAYENGTKLPPLDTVELIADYFDVSVDYLLGRTDNPSTGTKIDKDEDEFQAFANDPELNVFYKELPKSDEEAVRKLRAIWEIIKHEKK